MLCMCLYQQSIFSVHTTVEREASVSLEKDVRQLQYPHVTSFEIELKGKLLILFKKHFLV